MKKLAMLLMFSSLMFSNECYLQSFLKNCWNTSSIPVKIITFTSVIPILYSIGNLFKSYTYYKQHDPTATMGNKTKDEVAEIQRRLFIDPLEEACFGGFMAGVMVLSAFALHIYTNPSSLIRLRNNFVELNNYARLKSFL